MGILRLWLAMVVLLSHAPAGFLGHPLNGSLAVSAFYVISGFYIQFVIRERYEGTARWIVNFYKSRLLRIFPAYYLVLAISIIYVVMVGQYPWQPELDQVEVFHHSSFGLKIYYAFSNLFILGQDLGRFGLYDPVAGTMHLISNPDPVAGRLRASSLPLLGQAWSIAIELWFYLSAPFLLTRRTSLLLAIIAVSIFLRVAMLSVGFTAVDWRNAFFPTEIATFGLGAMACRFYFFALNDRPPRAATYTVAALALSAICLYSFRYQHISGRLGDWAYAIFVLLIALILPWLFHASRTWRFDRALGDLSYPMYLVHLAMIGLVARAGTALPTLAIWATALTIAFSVPIVLLVDRPIDSFRHRKFSRGEVDAVGGRALATTEEALG
ncbi:MAG: hypothetical protein JWL84_1796 [Rhodospirillales bacterium]|nr:hypothetical protein [Rhodospirillales bacterium]